MDEKKRDAIRRARCGDHGAPREALVISARLVGMTFVGAGTSIEACRKVTLSCPRCGRTRQTLAALLLAGVVKHSCDTGGAPA